MNSPAKSKTEPEFLKLLNQLATDFPSVTFKTADNFYWSAENQTVYYSEPTEHASWSLLHELGHVIQDHNTYSSDARLVTMEVEAWKAARQIATRFGHTISEEHIEDCMDSYRDWQHSRSKCPVCAQSGVEKQSGNYHCINCQHNWKVTANRFCRVYRQKSIN